MSARWMGIYIMLSYSQETFYFYIRALALTYSIALRILLLFFLPNAPQRKSCHAMCQWQSKDIKGLHFSAWLQCLLCAARPHLQCRPAISSEQRTDISLTRWDNPVSRSELGLVSMNQCSAAAECGHNIIFPRWARLRATLHCLCQCCLMGGALWFSGHCVVPWSCPLSMVPAAPMSSPYNGDIKMLYGNTSTRQRL